MLSFISFCLVCIGSLNWFCIGILQYDFVAGIFGSQSSVFSRLIYSIIGVASIIVVINMAKNKGKFIVSFKKANKEYDKFIEEKKEKNLALAKAESAKENDFKDSYEDNKSKIKNENSNESLRNSIEKNEKEDDDDLDKKNKTYHTRKK